MWEICILYLLAYLHPAGAEWLDRHMPSICCTALACLAMRFSPLHVNLTVVHPTKSVRAPSLSRLHPLSSSRLSTSDDLLFDPNLSYLSCLSIVFCFSGPFWFDRQYIDQEANISSLPFHGDSPHNERLGRTRPILRAAFDMGSVGRPSINTTLMKLGPKL